VAQFDGNDQPEIAFELLLALLYDADGKLTISRGAADWVFRLKERGEQAGYRTTGSPDGSTMTLHLVSPEHQ